MNRLLLSLLACFFFALTACESTPDPVYEPEPEPEPQPYVEPEPEPEPEVGPVGPNFNKSNPPADRPWKAFERESIRSADYQQPTFSEFMDGDVAKWRAALSPEFVPGKPHAMQNVKTSGSWWNGIGNLKVESMTTSGGGWKAHGYGEATFNSNGKLFAKAYFREGQLHGPVIMYREDGSLEKVTCYNMGKAEGPYASFTDGKLTTRGEHFTKSTTCEWVHWDAEGNLKERTCYDVAWNGTAATYVRKWIRKYNKEGQLAVLWPYKNGELHGDVIDWVDPVLDEEGKVTNENYVGRLELESWHDDKLHGWFTIYSQKEKYRVWDTWYEHGEQTGPIIKYDADGNITSRGQKLKGKDYGKWTGTDSAGNKYEYSYDKEGRLHGDYIVRNSSGKVIEEYAYEHGESLGAGLVSRKASVICPHFAEDPDEIWLGKGDLDENTKFDGEWEFMRTDGTLVATGTYGAGKRHGDWKFYHTDGTTLRVTCKYASNLLDGSYTKFYTGGTSEETGSYQTGSRSGLWTRWYENGQTKSVGSYYTTGFGSSSKEHGEWRYYREDGTLIRKGAYALSGSKTGLWNIYDEAGLVKLIESYNYAGALDGFIEREAVPEAVPEGTELDPDKMTGTWVWKSATLQITRRAVMINGESAGLYQQYYANGKLGMEGELIGESREGTWKVWTESGVLKEQADYVGNKKTGTYTAWRTDGTKQTEGNYTNDVKTGTWKSFHTDGETALTEYTYGTTGEYEGPHRTWTTSGQQTIEGNFSNGKRHGVWKEWHTDGTQKIETNYENGQFTGRHRTWHKNGKPEFDGVYKASKPIGEKKAWYDNGQMHYHEIYDESGLKQGTWLYWYSNGQQNMEHTYKDGVQLSHKRWYEDGKPMHEKFYDAEGNPTGIWKEWDKDGNLKSETNHDTPEEPEQPEGE